MLMELLIELSPLAITCVLLSALMVGVAKTFIGGLGVIIVILMATAFPGKMSTGVLLPMLIIADIFAVIFYRRDCQWRIIVKIFPMTAVGVLIGYFVLDAINDDFFGLILGFIILTMLLLSFFVSEKTPRVANSMVYTSLVGLCAGIATMIANAAGPLLGLYFLQLGLPKKNFVGTRSWYFLLLNLYKLPFSANLGLITIDTLTINFFLIPFIIMGAFIGVKLVAIIHFDYFKWIIRGAALAAVIKIIVFGI
jgi:uncharacterized membrane protein YfcA